MASTYGPPPSHALEAVKDRNFPGNFDNMLLTDYVHAEDEMLASGTFLTYVGAVEMEYAPLFVEDTGTRSPDVARSSGPVTDVRTDIRNSWAVFAKLITGRKGPFSKPATQRKHAELREKSARLCPSAPPRQAPNGIVHRDARRRTMWMYWPEFRNYNTATSSKSSVWRIRMPIVRVYLESNIDFACQKCNFDVPYYSFN